MRSILYSALCAAAIGYTFGVVFAVRAIEMSALADDLHDMLIVNGFVGSTFAILLAPTGVVALGIVNVARRLLRLNSRRARIYFMAWIVIGTVIAVPFLGYYYSSGVNPLAHHGADSAWDLIPAWLLRIGRWVGFSMLTASVLGFAATAAMARYFRIGDLAYGTLTLRRVAFGVPALVVVAWIVPPLYLSVARAVPPPEPGVEPRSVQVEPPVAPIILIGWDGATWDVIDPLLSGGRMPHLQRVIDAGVRAELASFVPTSSPLLWTTISTGRPPAQHGVRSQVENRFRGMDRWFFFPPALGFDRIFGRIWEQIGVMDRVQITSHARRRRAFWNILSEVGREVGLINWRVGWPAETLRGFNVTDHVHPFLGRLTGPDGTVPDSMSDAELIAGMPGALEPPVRIDLLERCLERGRERNRMLSVETGLPIELCPEQEVFAVELGREMARGVSVDVLAAYFYDLDGIEHQYWRYRTPEYFFNVDPDRLERYGDAIDQAYVFYDRLLGDILAWGPEGATVIIVSDHGHVPVFGEVKRSGGHAEAPPGILVAAGPGIARGAVTDGASVFDVFPTLMYLSGLPIEHGQRGRVLLELVENEIRANRPVRHVDAYAPREPPGDRPGRRISPVDREMIKKLRALGYVG